MRVSAPHRDDLSLSQKLGRLSFGLIVLVVSVTLVGLAMLYSAAHGAAEPWMSKQAIRAGIGIVIMIAIAVTDIRTWARWSYAIYAVALLLVVYVEVAGQVGMGAQRWIDLKFLQLQPSELMKIALIMALARYFHDLSLDAIGKPTRLILPIFLAIVPALLVLKQPDLGTAGVLLLAGASVFFVAGVRWWKFVIVLMIALAAFPIAWNHMRDYQKNRIMTFLDPESDMLGAGYHITQSKIALGSGGITGKGFLKGSQSHLDFLPERHTDFIFTMYAEEFGLLGGIVLLALYALLVLYGYVIANRSRSHFGRLLAVGLSVNLFLYFSINTAMVTGLIPVVGVPLPLVSYGGTALIAVLAGFGLLMSVNIHRDQKVGGTR
ncbi:MAG TPA: rod shape-determining protein RodA [Dongiaceae bacterium]|jgi:rod shape determining protein RodA|nr:rod shape-determining protein RodA [Dongiaceae bacterium]